MGPGVRGADVWGRYPTFERNTSSLHQQHLILLMLQRVHATIIMSLIFNHFPHYARFSISPRCSFSFTLYIR